MPHQSHIPHWPYCDSSSPSSLTGERDACGVGFLAQIEGISSHWILQQALRGLECMEHRGGCGGDGDSGDGAGILCEIPWSFLEKVWPAAKNSNNSTGLGMVFLPNDSIQRKKAKEQRYKEQQEQLLKDEEHLRLKEWEEKFDKKQKEKEAEELLKEERLKRKELQEKYLRERKEEDLSNDLTSRLENFDIEKTTREN